MRRERYGGVRPQDPETRRNPYNANRLVAADSPSDRQFRAKQWLIQQFYRSLQDHVPLQRFVRSGDVNGNVRRYAHGFEEFAIG